MPSSPATSTDPTPDDQQRCHPRNRTPSTIAPLYAYRVGQPVHAWLYGAWRDATITKIGRTRITAEIVANKAGRLHTKSLPLDHVQRRGLTTKLVADLIDGDRFSVDDGRTWHICCTPLQGNVSVYVDHRRGDAAMTHRVGAARDARVPIADPRAPARPLAELCPGDVIKTNAGRRAWVRILAIGPVKGTETGGVRAARVARFSAGLGQGMPFNIGLYACPQGYEVKTP